MPLKDKLIGTGVALFIGFFSFIAYEVYVIKSNHLSHIETDIAVMKTEMQHMNNTLKEIRDSLQEK